MKKPNTSFPVSIAISAAHLDEFINCEMGAQEDEITGPSPLTTVAILERNEAIPSKRTKANRVTIILNTVEEAAQVADCCRYGTFSVHHPQVAGRIFDEIVSIPGVRPVLEVHDREQWEVLSQIIQEAQ